MKIFLCGARNAVPTNYANHTNFVENFDCSELLMNFEPEADRAAQPARPGEVD